MSEERKAEQLGDDPERDRAANERQKARLLELNRSMMQDLVGDAEPDSTGAPHPLQRQVDELARVIQEEVPGEPSRSEGAIDTAIRLLRHHGIATGSTWKTAPIRAGLEIVADRSLNTTITLNGVKVEGCTSIRLEIDANTLIPRATLELIPTELRVQADADVIATIWPDYYEVCAAGLQGAANAALRRTDEASSAQPVPSSGARDDVSAPSAELGAAGDASDAGDVPTDGERTASAGAREPE